MPIWSIQRRLLSFAVLLLISFSNAWSQKGCNISPSEVQQLFAPEAQVTAVPGNPCKFSFLDPLRASHGAFTLEIRPKDSSDVSSVQFENQIAAIRSRNMLCRMELNLGARAAFCYNQHDAELLVLHGSVVSTLFAGNQRGPNPTRMHLVELAKIVFDIESESAPLKKPQD